MKHVIIIYFRITKWTQSWNWIWSSISCRQSLETFPSTFRFGIKFWMPFNNSTFVQGDLNSKRDGVAFLTVHDIGSNHKPLARFAALPCMEEISSRAVFVHVCVPGQDRGAEDFGADFPSMQVQIFSGYFRNSVEHFRIWALGCWTFYLTWR